MKSHHIVAIGTWGGDKQQLIEYNSCIAVGIDCPRAKLRVSILLDTIQEYQVRYISSDEEISEAVNKAGLIIGARGIAHEGILQRKPVIVVGEYGFGGLVTPDTLHEQCSNYFKGKINGIKEEYFSLERLEEEIKRGFTLTFQDLQMMSNQTIRFLHNI